MKQIKGDLVVLAEEGVFDVIIHGCNCFNTMGAGIAKTIKEHYPAAYWNDCQTQRGDKTKLGGYSWVMVKSAQGFHFTIINAYTQYTYGKGCRVDYDAVRSVFKMIAANYSQARIGYPKIGAGLGGGDWARISSIINSTLNNCDHTLVIYK